MQVIKTNILNPLSKDSVSYHSDQFITIKESRIADISSNPPQDDYIDYTDKICLPGFIDMHVHLSQVNVRGKHSKGLLEWLNSFIFREEKRSADTGYATKLAEQFFATLSTHGTTTAVIYVAPYPEACDIAFQKAKESGIRTIMGQTLMDRNCPDELCRGTEQQLEEAIDLYHKWNRATPLIEYVFTPRFAPVCSPELMNGIGKFATGNDAYIQTHLAENLKEISRVRELFPESRNYTEVYQRHGLLGSKTLLGHAIHLDDEELAILAATKSKITHCPDSNFFLHSGTFPIARILKHNIDFALGSDVGAGTSLFMPHIMKMFIYRQDEYPVTLENALYYTTLGAAKVLGKENEIGSVEKGKEADLIFMNFPEDIDRNSEELLSYLIYLSNPKNIYATYVAGKECYIADN